jgi:hypothetical protein
MHIAMPFLQMLERYNGMLMTPVETDALEEAIAAAPVEDQNFEDRTGEDETIAAESPPPRLTLVASR